MCLIFAVDCMLLKFCLFVPGTMCIGGRLAKTGVNSATVSRLAIPVYNLQMSHGTRHMNSAGYWAKCSSVPVLGLQVDIWTCSPVFIHQYGHIDELCHQSTFIQKKINPHSKNFLLIIITIYQYFSQTTVLDKH